MQISKILTTISILVITWAPTHYTIDEMQAKAYDSEKGILWEGWGYDTSEESMGTYNRLLDYTENVAKVDYKIEKIMRYYTDDNDKSRGYNYCWLMKFDQLKEAL